MKNLNIIFSCLIFSLLGCSSTTYLKVEDTIQVRQVIPDDPLAARFESTNGEELRLGDAVLTDRSIDRIQVPEGSNKRYNLIINLKGADDARWKSFARRHHGKQAALIYEGKVLTVFTIEKPEEESEQTVKLIFNEVIPDKDAAEQLLKKFEAKAIPQH